MSVPALPILAPAVGSVVVIFVIIEEALTFWVDIIYRAAGGKLIADRPPLPLGAKAKFLRRCFRDIKALEAYRAEAEGLLGRAEAIAEMRNIVAHGVPFDSEENDGDLIVSFRRLHPSRNGDGHDGLVDRVSIKQMVALGYNNDDVAAGCQALAKKLADKFIE